MRDQQVFSDAQDVTTLDSTGVVSTNVFDMELDASGGNTIIEDDQVKAWLVVEILASDNAAGTEGMIIQLRGSNTANMTTTPEYLGNIQLKKAEIVTGGKYCIEVYKNMATKFLGAWYIAVSTSLDGNTTIDCYMHSGPVSPNDAIQKVPA